MGGHGCGQGVGQHFGLHSGTGHGVPHGFGGHGFGQGLQESWPNTDVATRSDATTIVFVRNLSIFALQFWTNSLFLLSFLLNHSCAIRYSGDSCLG